MKYYAYLKQNGEGCDYTIGCAQTLITFNADNDQDAIEKLSENILENYTGEFSLESAIIFKDPINVNLNSIYEVYRKRKEESKKKRQHIKDMEEYQRLRKKFENK